MARIAPATYELRIPQRATLEEIITLKAGGVPVDLTGCEVLASVWDSLKRRTLLLSLAVVWLDRTMGTFKLTATRAQTRAVMKSGFWDLLVKDASGNADYWLEGPATLDVGLTDDQ